eukprot:GHVU01126187.1.p1 GENE.GHVU01126187.1~~GHVU01126187.1.p1  ORF type:complete len:138 (+),score=9.01 GHVU01126187.1:595-1008(+)
MQTYLDKRKISINQSFIDLPHRANAKSTRANLKPPKVSIEDASHKPLITKPTNQAATNQPETQHTNQSFSSLTRPPSHPRVHHSLIHSLIHSFTHRLNQSMDEPLTNAHLHTRMQTRTRLGRSIIHTFIKSNANDMK